jgi:integrase
MNRLRPSLADYLAVRRVLGFKLVRTEKLLAQFVTYLEDRGSSVITTEMALAWATLPQAGSAWSYARLSAVRRFAVHMRSIEPATEIPPKHILVQRKQRATPFLYSATDLSALADATAILAPARRAETMRTLILLLSVTGMRIGEAIRLNVEDFDAAEGVLTVRNTKFGKTREVPLHPTTVAAIGRYLDLADRPSPRGGTSAVFLSSIGTRLDYNSVQQTFRRLVDHAGLQRRSHWCRPRLHDLRHSFAVNTILDGYRNGDQPGNRIALLATYLGHVDPSSTYWYLSAAPELMALACDRLETHLGGGT